MSKARTVLGLAKAQPCPGDGAHGQHRARRPIRRTATAEPRASDAIRPTFAHNSAALLVF